MSHTWTFKVKSQNSKIKGQNFQEDKVKVEIYTPDGVLLESGLAPYNEALTYKYTATLGNNQLHGTRIKVIATDLPGGEGVREVRL